MASEIRVNSLTNRSGLSTVTIADTGAVVAGMITATTFSGPLTGAVTGNVTGNLTGNVTGNSDTASNLTGSPSITVTDITTTGNVSVGGTLTYEDVTNIDAVGIITAQSDVLIGGNLSVTSGISTFKSLDYAAIDSTISDTAVDVFIYDTSKDSDGGAWRKRTQNTSWYNETLGTATRGTRREFPAVAVIVAETTKVTIYDGDDPDLPMWMVFNVANDTWLKLYSSAPQCSCITALNGILCAGGNGTGIRLAVVDFIKDDQYLTEAGHTYYQTTKGIITRNDVTSHSSDGGSKSIVNNVVNDVAMTVLPNAPIDSATGLPVPTIAVATAGGVSVIKDDGTVVDITASAGSSYNSAKFISISSDGFLVFPQHGSSATTGEYSLMTIPIPSSDRTTQTNSSNATDKYIFNDTNAALTALPHGLGTSQNGALRIPGTQFLNYPNGLAILDENPSSVSNAMVAYIKSNYNTGWMHGNIKGAFLSDTDDTNKTNGQTDPDRSVNNNALNVIGTITKTPVATGADLVAYSGWSTSNYLEQPINTDMNVGTGDFYVMGWIYPTSNTTGYVWEYAAPSNNSGYTEMFYHDSGELRFYIEGGSGAVKSVSLNVWQHFVCLRRSGQIYVYVNGDSGSPVSDTASLDNTSAKLRIGIRAYTVAGPFYGKIALVRMGASAPSPEQIKKIYEDERWLFQENAKATLYGSSDAVTALAYDDTTELLHVGTSDGRSDFQGLRRINNTTVGITSAISASNELVAEQ